MTRKQSKRKNTLGEDGLIELLLDAEEVITRLQAHLNGVMRSQERSRRKPLVKDEDRGLPNSQMRLPKLDLPTFNGDLLNWQGFWDTRRVHYEVIH